MKTFHKAALCAALMLGLSACDSTDEVKQDMENAAKGSAEAQCSLGIRYLYGDGVGKNDAEGVKWFMKAAEQGEAEAQFHLGVCYFNGIGVNEDTAEAVKWFTKAAEQRHSFARDALKTLTE